MSLVIKHDYIPLDFCRRDQTVGAPYIKSSQARPAEKSPGEPTSLKSAELNNALTQTSLFSRLLPTVSNTRTDSRLWPLTNKLLPFKQRPSMSSLCPQESQALRARVSTPANYKPVSLSCAGLHFLSSAEQTVGLSQRDADSIKERILENERRERPLFPSKSTLAFPYFFSFLFLSLQTVKSGLKCQRRSLFIPLRSLHPAQFNNWSIVLSPSFNVS